MWIDVTKSSLPVYSLWSALVPIYCLYTVDGFSAWENWKDQMYSFLRSGDHFNSSDIRSQPHEYSSQTAYRRSLGMINPCTVIESEIQLKITSFYFSQSISYVPLWRLTSSSRDIFAESLSFHPPETHQPPRSYLLHISGERSSLSLAFSSFVWSDEARH